MKYYLLLFFASFLMACADTSSNTDATTKPTKADASQYFQGEIHYKYSYSSETLNLGYLESKRPKRGVFKYDLQHYQSIFYGPSITSYYYSGITNHAISSIDGAFDINCTDYGINPDSLLHFEVHPTDEKILGQDCMIVEFQTPNVYTRYHVSKSVFLAPDTYQKHLAYNWSLYGEQGKGGIILKAEHFFSNFTMIGEVSKIVPYENGERAWDITEDAFAQACR